MKILFLLSNRQPPSSRLRITCMVPALEREGWSCNVLPIASDPIERLRMVRACARHDAVVLQKKTSLHAPELFLMRRANPNLLFDFDDAVMFHELEHGKSLRVKSFAKFLRTVRACRAVVAGNEFLAGFARPICREVRVLPTPIDTERYVPKTRTPSSGGLTVGWLGTPGGLPHVAALADVLRTVAAKVEGFRLKIVSSEFIDLPGIDIVKKRYRVEEEVADLQSFDIGIMPLQDTLWTRGKCGFKILQYMGVGVPAVASPVGINSELIRHGETGFLATDAEAWREALLAFAADADLRHRMGTAGRVRVVEGYSQTRYTSRYRDLLSHLCGDGELGRRLPAP
jgi:glycosyltransferase involved in cell wall biosynthesis